MALSGICTWTNHGIVWTNQYFLLGFDKLPMDIMLGSRFSRARDRAWKKPWKIRLWLMEALHGLCMSEVRVYLGACATWNEVQKKRPNDSTVGAHNLVNCWNWPFTSECPAFLGCVFFHTDWTKKIWISLANSMDLKEHIWNLASEMLFLDVLESIKIMLGNMGDLEDPFRLFFLNRTWRCVETGHW